MLRIGTSGWAYKHWIDRFYPDDLKPDDYLRYYAQEFTEKLMRSRMHAN